jgi:hypothetical protein
MAGIARNVELYILAYKLAWKYISEDHKDEQSDIARHLAYGRLPKGKNHPAWGLYGGPIAQSTKRLLTRLTGLPWAEYEPHRKEVAERLGYHATTIDWLTKHDKARAETPAAVKSRRARLRKTSATRRARVSGAKGAPGSVAVLSISPSSGSRTSSAPSMAAATGSIRSNQGDQLLRVESASFFV